MEERHNFLYATLSIIGISFIGIIASAYYFQINEVQKNVISLYEAQKFQEEAKQKALVAKNKHKTLTKNDKVNNSIKEDKSSKVAENEVKSVKINQKQKKDKNIKLKPNELVENKPNKVKFVRYNSDKKYIKSSSKKTKSKKCNKVKKYCPITRTKVTPETEKTYIQPSAPQRSTSNTQTVVTKPNTVPQNYYNAPAVVQGNESNSSNTSENPVINSSPELKPPTEPVNP